jgi:hypothetical protein
MNIEVSQEQGNLPVTVFRIEGRINMSNTEELQNLAQQYYQDGMQNLVLDLQEVPSLTSAALRTILSIYKMLTIEEPSDSSEEFGVSSAAGNRPKSDHLKLANPSDYVLKVLQTAGFDRYLEIYDSVPDAIASY